MAHHAKYNTQALGHMLGHYNRDKGCYSRDNIDPERSDLNYVLITNDRAKDGLTDREFIDKRCDEADHRETKATVKMVDVCLTVPKDYKGDIDRFFESAFSFMAQRYGEKNIIGGYVHMDEKDARPHMHFSFVPVLERDGKERLCAKEVVDRQDLRTFHKDLEKSLERDHIHARVLNGATRELREQLQQERATREFYEREFKLDREQQERLNKYLEQQKEINHLYNREMLQDREHKHDKDR